MTDRREFIRRSLMGSAVILAPSLSGMMAPDIYTGIILYTVRDEMKRDPENTLRTLAEMGFNWIEAADYTKGAFYGRKPADFRRRVEYYGMELISAHCNVDEKNIDTVITDAAEAGLKYVILPSLPVKWRRSINKYIKAVDFLNHAGYLFKEAGMKFGYHNHSFEFTKKGSVIPYDIMLSETDPELVAFELDICWMTAAGVSAVEYISRFPGRFEIFHMKDMTSDKNDATLGEGIIDFKPIFALMEKAGMRYFFIEQDNCLNHTPLESARIGRDYLLRNMRK